VLVTGASLTIESLSRLTSVETGLNPQNVLTADLGLPRARYKTAADAATFRRRLYESALAIPGMVAIRGISSLPFATSSSFLYVKNLNTPRTGRMYTVSGDYFRAVGLPVVAGRAFTAADGPDAARVIIINRTFGRLAFGLATPIGRELEIEFRGESPRTVVGVVGDIREQSLDGAGADSLATPEFYVPELQPLSRNALAMTLVLRTAAAPAGTVERLRESVAALDPEVPLFRVRTMRDILFQSTAPPRFRALVLAAFASLAFLLAVFGVNGVAAYATAARTQEIGLRISLGAQRADILFLVLDQGVRMGISGAAIGVALSLWLTRFLSSLLFGVKASDPLVHAAAALVLVGAVIAASVVPALRAARTSPMSALKYE
jgi:putative ABC transport system permease protein